MRAAVALRADAADPLAGLAVCDWPEPRPRPDWVVVRVRAASLNHHDLWTLRGAGAPRGLPVVLGSDGAGTAADGTRVLVHGVVGDPAAGAGDETLDPKRTLLGEDHDGTLAEQVEVPARNLVPLPAGLSLEHAACLPGAWLTAYRMLTEKAALGQAATVLVQGAGGGVATALTVLGTALGHRVWVTSGDEHKRRMALGIGAEAAFAPGQRLPERVDAVMETVGPSTWEHSARSVRPGGRIVVAGATSGRFATLDLARVFFHQLTVVGVTMGTRAQLAELARFCVESGVRPVVDRTLPLARVRDGIAALARGTVFGKVVITV
ncbi:zinc-binding dehydrogenase [Actinokineospora enzanensis]|uniref:zinc-binding dehydrogenase n=1 Tax=Actinokineospora enzanensis TaxID=155975 RepID=UPI0003826110|nr:zinc-binding dehydrogenase [Actinokineospora enzanensis]